MDSGQRGAEQTVIVNAMQKPNVSPYSRLREGFNLIVLQVVRGPIPRGRRVL